MKWLIAFALLLTISVATALGLSQEVGNSVENIQLDLPYNGGDRKEEEKEGAEIIFFYGQQFEGDGFFSVTLPTGQTAYSRSGAFKVNSSGALTTSEGFLITPGITVPTTALSVTIGTDGTVSVINAGQTAPTTLGQLTLVKFQNPAGLNSLGRNLLLETNATGAPLTGTPGAQGFGTIAQGFVKNSNVAVVDELVALIEAQRAYEINSRTVQTSDEMLRTVSDLKR